MSRQSHIRQTKSFGSKYASRRQQQASELPDAFENEDQAWNTGPPSKASISLFDKINKIFDDPTSISSSGLDDYYDAATSDGLFAKSKTTHSTTTQNKGSLGMDKKVSGQDVLSKAKSLLEQKHDEIPVVKERQKLKMKMSQKENTFVTGVGLYHEVEEEEESKKRPVEQDLEVEPEDFDENEYLKDLKKQTEYDDLEELRRMIAATKKEIHGYAGEVVSLKNSINDLNMGYKGSGFSMDEDLFYEMDRDYHRLGTSSGMREIRKPTDDDQKNIKRSFTSISKKNPLIMAGSTASASMGNSTKKPPASVRQPVLDKVFGSVHSMGYTASTSTSNKFARAGSGQSISGSKANMRTTFY